jgi:hypothetical protein
LKPKRLPVRNFLSYFYGIFLARVPFNIAGEPQFDFYDSNFLNDLKSGKNNNGQTFFVNRFGADEGYPIGPLNETFLCFLYLLNS